jgi:hypothetical protein
MTKRIRQNLKFRIVSTTVLVSGHFVLGSDIGWKDVVTRMMRYVSFFG